VTDRLSFEEGEERGDVKKGGRTKEGFSSVKTRQNKCLHVQLKDYQ
jgi:hypothetical protein